MKTEETEKLDTFKCIMAIAPDEDADEDADGDYEHEAEADLKSLIKQACEANKWKAADISYKFEKDLGYEDGNYLYSFIVTCPSKIAETLESALDNVATSAVQVKAATMIDKELLKALRDDINSALKSVAEKHGVSINAGNASFSAEMATFKLEITAQGDGGEVQSKYAIEFKRYAKALGMKEDDLGREFTLNGQKFTFSGFLPKAVKYSMVAKGEDGREYKLEEQAVKKALGY